MNLKKELKQRFKLDQKLSKDKNWRELEKVYQENTNWLKEIINNYGWPSQDIYSEQAAWLIVQHSEDLNFQKKCLKIIGNLPLTRERKGYIAYLTDRILIKEDKKQIYGTQFLDNNPYEIIDERYLDKRRAEMGLGLFSEYKLMMQKCY